MHKVTVVRTGVKGKWKVLFDMPVKPNKTEEDKGTVQTKT